MNGLHHLVADRKVLYLVSRFESGAMESDL